MNVTGLTMTKRWMIVLKVGAFRVPVFSACLLMTCMLGNNPVVLADEEVRTHALLINGGGNQRINYQSHLLHVKRIFRLLSEAGVPGNQISILSADGSDPGSDLATRDVQTESDFWMLVGTRLEKPLRPRIKFINSEIQGASLQAATRESLQQWFKNAAGSLGSGDTLLIYVTDHGTRNKDDLANNRITLWGEKESIGVEGLRELINMLQPTVRVVTLMSQCYSGSFANLIYAKNGDELPRVNLGGFFSSTADRPAYGCYPENRDKYHVGHSFRFFDALESGGSLSEAHRDVLVTDRTPDVPLRASDLYLESILSAGAESLGIESDELVDQWLQKAWKDKKDWETDIRLLDRMGQAFGYFSPRFLSELSLHSDTLAATGKQLESYKTAWTKAQRSLNHENLNRFLDSHPDWASRLTADALKPLSETERIDISSELLIDFVAYTEKDPITAGRLKLLREKAEATREASYRAQVRVGVVLRMRIMLISIAGRQYLSQNGSDVQRKAFENMSAHESFALRDADESRDQRVVVEPFPSFEDELKITESSLPGWMGIRFRAVSAVKRNKYQLDGGAVTVQAVFPDSPAKKAGLEAGDIIIGRPGQPFTERDFVREWVMTAPIGEAQSLQVKRGENQVTLALTPEPYPRKWPSLPGPPKVGSPAPSISSLETIRGKPVEELTQEGPYLLFFWATWCGPCKAALPELVAYEREQKVTVLSITDEEAETVDAFLQKHKGPFPEAVVLDERRSSFLAYGVSGTPRFVLVDKQGVIKSFNSGYRPSLGLVFDDWEWNKEQPAGGK
jgi:thiol-disulfide isomerase/thioredoxin